MSKFCNLTAMTIFVVLLLGPMVANDTTAQERRAINIWSDGTRMSGDLWLPAGIIVNETSPAIVLAQGWGGLRKELTHPYVTDFTAAGFVVMTFDYRGWGDSDSRLVMVETQPELDLEGMVTVRAKAIRGVIDPQDQVTDVLAAVAFVMSEPQVNPDKIGLWGISYGGGHVMEAAAREPQIAAVVAHVGFMGVSRTDERLVLGRLRAMQKARGEIDPIPVGLDQLGGGSPDFARMVAHRPIDNAHKIRAATLIIDAEDDQYFDSVANGRAVFDIVKQRAAAEYRLFPGDHYTVYGPHREEALALTIDWFRIHLD